MAAERNRTNNKKIWDDSALVDSWNDALNEYKKYHSVHARGGSVEDIEGDDPSTTKGSAPAEAQGDHVDGQPNASGQEEGEEEGEAMPVDENLENVSDARRVSTTGTHDPPADGGADQVPMTFPPQAVMGSIQDENFKKLLMSWYYAGYYTGLYEGRQQQQQQQTEQSPS
ncbi:Survival motor neuron-like protein 1 [Tolypocladium paradoxum]|uniref:Survival motor neuron-like protein 1 n=1 Tax=Tolypocladium paradoxum TaxID=94208 RepID=A0A2S4KRY8_9HYPO|nr:Survival motor neuron-like protein 1 [Tolypocladium paradoxum]